jgi:NADH-quinone oxidoreductase subunit E
MLTAAERADIDPLFAHLPVRSGAAIDALRIVQQHRGWVSDDAIADVAQHLGMAPAEVDGIATFYNRIHRRPVGRHVIHVCDSMSCWVMGCDAVFASLREQLRIGPGETTADGRFTVLPIQCLGACDRAPTLLIDDELLGHVDAAMLQEALGRHGR